MNEVMKKLIELELKLLDPKTSDSKEDLDYLFSSSYVEYSASGKILSKDMKIAQILRNRDLKFDIENFQIKEVSSCTYLTTYQIPKAQDGSYSGSLRSSIWESVGDSWRLIFQQGTKSLF